MISQDVLLRDLILVRMAELGIDARALGYRLGFQNPRRATGRVYALCNPSRPLSDRSRRVLSKLPAALELPPQQVARAVQMTERHFANVAAAAEAKRQSEIDCQNAAWRATFRPHAVLVTERRQPTSITSFALTGGPERWLVVELDPDRPPVTYAQQVLSALPDRCVQDPRGKPGVPFFGALCGFVVNYTPAQAVQFDLEGRPIAALKAAFLPGEASLSVRGRGITACRLLGT